MGADLISIGHEPKASLTVFEDAGHCCSPLVDKSLIHGKIWLMLLRAGITGPRISDSLELKGALAERRTMAQLTDFCKALGLHWKTDSEGGLIVRSHDELSMSFIA